VSFGKLKGGPVNLGGVNRDSILYLLKGRGVRMNRLETKLDT